jgi:sporulation protein YlmC with PRC-barrel domain
MMRTLLTTTALVALLSGGALAQNAATPAPTHADLLTHGYSVVDTDGLASKLMGFPIYNSPANDAEQIGQIKDLVIDQNGDVAAVIVGVGGFLGMGEKNVAVNYSDLQWTVAQDNTERVVLAGVTKEQLEAAVAVEMMEDAPMQTAATPAPAPVPAAPVTNTDANMATGTVNPAPNTMAPAPADQTALNREGLTDFDEMTLTADQLKGTNVYGPDNQHIGTIGDLVLGEDGKSIDAIIIDFGGFLGIGTKQVAVAFEDLQFYTDANGNSRSLVLNVTREQMEAAPDFNRDTYAAERATQRLVVSPALATAG